MVGSLPELGRNWKESLVPPSSLSSLDGRTALFSLKCNTNVQTNNIRTKVQIPKTTQVFLGVGSASKKGKYQAATFLLPASFFSSLDGGAVPVLPQFTLFLLRYYPTPPRRTAPETAQLSAIHNCIGNHYLATHYMCHTVCGECT